MNAVSHLSDHHLAMLRASAISDDVIAARGYRSITNADELQPLGFAPSQRRAPGLLLPHHGPDGSNSVYVYRPDSPRVNVNKRKRDPDGQYHNDAIKYEYPKDTAMRVDCPPTCRALLGNPQIPLWITEGQKKADALASIKQCAIALLGVWNFKTTNKDGGKVFNDANFDHIALNGRDVRIVFDSDVMRKSEVKQALDRLTAHLQRKGAHVTSIYLPPSDKGKQGVDDYLAAGHTLADLERLIESPRTAPKAAEPMVELLDVEPPTMRRPLALIDGRAYAATWLTVKVTQTESVNKQGQIIKHDPPITTHDKRLFIVRDDGALFGEGQGLKPLRELGLEARLPEVPQPEKLWSKRGVMDYRAGQRPAAPVVFAHIVSVVDRFIDFERSLTDQRTMSEMIACYVLATWYLNAFDVIGYLWPNADRGSGKTKLLTVICELAYLGQVILAGGSYATLRDLADYGATLAFDDAENMSDPKRTDPDKRNLLLAGNRRGSTVTVKESSPNGQWSTRYVNTFCPRLFSATMLPDAILASRTIVVPLIRTPDREKANAEPLEFGLWPHDRCELLDDLWALALAHLTELRAYERQVNDRARLVGRSLERWRALLAVALWLDEQGVTGLWERMESLSVAYREEQPNLETGDLMALVIRALCECAVNAVSGDSAVKSFTVETKAVTEKTVAVVEDTEADINVERITSRRVGRVLNKMRLEKGGLKQSRTSKLRDGMCP